MKIILMFLGILFLGASQPVQSNNPCSKDINKYCSGVAPGEGRLAHCMRQHASLLSSGCKKFGEEYEKKHPGVGKNK